MTPSTLRLLGIAGAIVALAGLTWIGLGYRRDRGPLVERIDKIRGYVADARAEQRTHQPEEHEHDEKYDDQFLGTKTKHSNLLFI